MQIGIAKVAARVRSIDTESISVDMLHSRDHDHHHCHPQASANSYHCWRVAVHHLATKPVIARKAVSRTASGESSRRNDHNNKSNDKSTASETDEGGPIRKKSRRSKRYRLRGATAAMQGQETPAPSWTAGLTTRALGFVLQLPKFVPTQVLRLTSPEGPYPAILNLPSRDAGRTIPIYVFIPPPQALASSQLSAPVPNAPAGAKKVPVLVDFHGGGFIYGEPLEQAPWCASLARSGILSISVAYRLAPEHVFPAALHDCEDVMRAVLEPESDAGQFLRKEVLARSTLTENAPVGDRGDAGAAAQEPSKPFPVELDERRIAMSGFSSGGNVALNMLLSLPARLSQWPNKETSADWPSPFPPSYPSTIPALLFYPSLDARQAPYERKRPAGMAGPSNLELWMGKSLKNAYLSPDLVANLRASPGLAPLGVAGGAQGEVRVRQAAHQGQDARNTLKEMGTSTSEAGGGGDKNNDDDGFDSMHPKTRALLILSEFDTLAEQSETWVEVLRAADKLVDDQKTYDPDDVGLGIDHPIRERPDHKAQVRVHRIKGRNHGWTQMPDAFLGEDDRKSKALVMENARKFVVNMFLEQQQQQQQLK